MTEIVLLDCFSFKKIFRAFEGRPLTLLKAGTDPEVVLLLRSGKLLFKHTHALAASFFLINTSRMTISQNKMPKK